MKLGSVFCSIYKYVNALSNKIVRSTLIDPIGLITILNNLDKALPSYISLFNSLKSNICQFFEFLKVHSIILNKKLEMTLIKLLVDNTFHMHLYYIHSVPMVSIVLHMIIQIQLINAYILQTNSEQYYVDPIGIDILKCLFFRGHFSSLSEGLYQLQGSSDFALALYFNNDKRTKRNFLVSVSNYWLKSVIKIAL